MSHLPPDNLGIVKVRSISVVPEGSSRAPSMTGVIGKEGALC